MSIRVLVKSIRVLIMSIGVLKLSIRVLKMSIRVLIDERVRVHCTGSPSTVAIAVRPVEDRSVVTHAGVPFVVPVNALGGGRVQAQAGAPGDGGIRLVDCARAEVASSSRSTLALPFGEDR
jgi:hypothetical protein